MCFLKSKSKWPNIFFKSPFLSIKGSNFISFDYNSHKILSDKNISHKLIDDFLNDYDRKKIFNQSNQYLKKIEKFSDSDLNFHGINFIRNIIIIFILILKIQEKDLIHNMKVQKNHTIM